MEWANRMREVAGRPFLTLVPEWILAGIVSVSVGLAANHFGQTDTWEWLVLAGIPQLWAGGRTLHWASRAWGRSQARGQARPVRLNLTRVRYVGEEVWARVQGRWFVDDYAKFMDFCHYVLHNHDVEQRWPPYGTPPAVARRWLYVLILARVVIEVPGDRGWEVVGSIRTVRDVSHRIGKEELRQTVHMPSR
jgi:hypothetical protein